MSDGLYFSLEQAAEYMGLQISSLKIYIFRFKIPHIKSRVHGNTYEWCIAKSDLDIFMRSGINKGSGNAPSTAYLAKHPFADSHPSRNEHLKKLRRLLRTDLSIRRIGREFSVSGQAISDAARHFLSYDCKKRGERLHKKWRRRLKKSVEISLP